MAKKLKIYNGASWEDVTFAITPPNTAVTNAFTTNQVIETSTSVAALRITQNGSGEAFRVEDEANPDASPFVITATGNVGIGTGSPYYRLSVNGTLNAYSGVAGLGRIFLGDPADTNGYIGLYRSALGPANYNTAGNGLNFASIDGYVFSTASPPNYIHGVQSERMRIASDGTLSLQYVDASAPVLYNTSNNNICSNSRNKLFFICSSLFAKSDWNFWILC